MSRVTPAQVSFNGGELSHRLRARTDQNFYAIALAEMVGFAPTVEGPAEAMPGFIHIQQLLGPSRVVQFEVTTTQGHALYFSEGKVEIFTNDALIATIDSPYSWEEVQQLTFRQSYDVLYCFHPSLPPRKFYRDDAVTFGFEVLTFDDGPFESRNKNKASRVSASGVTGNVALVATEDLFADGDVGGLFRMEAEDLGDIKAWEPYTTVEVGQYLTANDRVYQVVGGNPDGDGDIRTGTLTPVHTEGVEWDGIADGVDVNDKPAGGVQLEYIHDRWGVVRITAYTDAQNVDATVLRRLPFSGAANDTYGTGGYYWDGEGYVYVPPTGYAYGTYRWSFGSFSDRLGWPRCGAIWNERLCLARDSTVFMSVAGDLESHAEYNEAGEVSDDMAIIAILQDPNPVLHLEPGERLQAITSAAVHALWPASAAKGVAPGNVQARRQGNAGGCIAAPVEIDSRTIHIDRSRGRIYETQLDPARQVDQPIDLTRYARHIGRAQFVEVAAQQHPFNHLVAVTGDGQMALAAYLPEEQVLGFARRFMAEGLQVRSCCTITDPDGLFDQVCVAAEFGGAWHALRMAPWRQDGESDLSACMVDLAMGYEGEPETDFTHELLPNTELHVVADGAFLTVTTDAAGSFTLPYAASKVWAGLPYKAWIESLDFDMGGDNGPARAKTARFGRAWVEMKDARGLSFGVPADPERDGDTADMAVLEDLRGDSVTDSAFPAFSGFRLREAVGDHTRHPRLRIERVAPFQSTVLGWGGDLNMEKL